MHPKGTSCGRLQVEVRARLDLVTDPVLFAGNQNPFFEMASNKNTQPFFPKKENLVMKKAQQKPKRRRIKFTLTAKAAKKVYLVGDFNEWDEKANPMKKSADGTWARSVLLFPGNYEYKFLVDGDWKEDPLNPNRCRNQFDTYNCIVEVA
jgi:1,4-alpha-glucan branching enzyme